MTGVRFEERLLAVKAEQDPKAMPVATPARSEAPCPAMPSLGESSQPAASAAATTNVAWFNCGFGPSFELCILGFGTSFE